MNIYVEYYYEALLQKAFIRLNSLVGIPNERRSFLEYFKRNKKKNNIEKKNFRKLGKTRKYIAMVIRILELDWSGTGTLKELKRNREYILRNGKNLLISGT